MHSCDQRMMLGIGNAFFFLFPTEKCCSTIRAQGRMAHCAPLLAVILRHLSFLRNAGPVN
jgi:hypothetical protein